VQDLSCTDGEADIDERGVVGVAQALTPHGEKSSTGDSTCGRGVQDLSCTDGEADIDERGVVGVAFSSWRRRRRRPGCDP